MSMKTPQKSIGNLAALLPKFLRSPPSHENLKTLEKKLSTSERIGFAVPTYGKGKRVEIEYSHDLLIAILREAFRLSRNSECTGDLSFLEAFNLLLSSGLSMFHEHITTKGFDGIEKYPSRSVKKADLLLNQLKKIQSTIHKLHVDTERLLPDSYFENLVSATDHLMNCSLQIQRSLSAYQIGKKAADEISKVRSKHPKMPLKQLIHALEEDLSHQPERLKVAINATDRLLDRARKTRRKK